MRIEEAEYIGKVLTDLTKKNSGSVLNLGSSTKEFREVVKPHIDENLFKPLKMNGVDVVHSDLKSASGVDIYGSIFDKETQLRLKDVNPSVIMLCNLLEHLEPEQLRSIPSVINKITPPGGYVIVSVPYSYPLHYDPIDNYFRPSPEKLLKFFTGYEEIESKIIVSATYFDDLYAQGWRRMVKSFVRIFLPMYQPKGWFVAMHRLLWLFRHYKVTCVVLRKVS